jgi:hypothetical protein
MANGWVKRTYEEIARLYESAIPIVAEWHNGQGGELTLYDDGMIESEGALPIDLLAFVLVEWHAYQRALAAGEGLRLAG